MIIAGHPSILDVPNGALNGLSASATGATNLYMIANPDVWAMFQANNYGMTEDQFAQYHYDHYGINEKRLSPVELIAENARFSDPVFVNKISAYLDYFISDQHVSDLFHKYGHDQAVCYAQAASELDAFLVQNAMTHDDLSHFISDVSDSPTTALMNGFQNALNSSLLLLTPKLQAMLNLQAFLNISLFAPQSTYYEQWSLDAIRSQVYKYTENSAVTDADMQAFFGFTFAQLDARIASEYAKAQLTLPRSFVDYWTGYKIIYADPSKQHDPMPGELIPHTTVQQVDSGVAVSMAAMGIKSPFASTANAQQTLIDYQSTDYQPITTAQTAAQVEASSGYQALTDYTQTQTQTQTQGSEIVTTPTNAYLAANPDVWASYQANNYGMTQDQFATYHFAHYGVNEQRQPVTIANIAVEKAKTFFDTLFNRTVSDSFKSMTSTALFAEINAYMASNNITDAVLQEATGMTTSQIAQKISDIYTSISSTVKTTVTPVATESTVPGVTNASTLLTPTNLMIGGVALLVLLRK